MVDAVTVYPDNKAANVFRLSTWVQKGNHKRKRVTGVLSILPGGVWPGDWVNEAYRAYMAADGRDGQKLISTGKTWSIGERAFLADADCLCLLRGWTPLHWQSGNPSAGASKKDKRILSSE